VIIVVGAGLKNPAVCIKRPYMYNEQQTKDWLQDCISGCRVLGLTPWTPALFASCNFLPPQNIGAKACKNGTKHGLLRENDSAALRNGPALMPRPKA
jgi:hypothetical protein